MLKVGFKVVAIGVFLFMLKFFWFQENNLKSNVTVAKKNELLQIKQKDTVYVKKDVLVKRYFKYLDSIVLKYDSLTSYKLNEHLLVRANSWIIDTLQHTDYYRMKARDSFVYDQRKMIVLPENSSIIIPDTVLAKKLQKSFKNTLIVVNIPEYRLRIYEDSLELYSFPIRVGKNVKKYLKASDRVQDLRTKIGEGVIVKHFRNPIFTNPVTSKAYKFTRRDDKKLTKMPQIPSIETEINRLRSGQMIHVTTNPKTLGKAYSNGCIGLKEADAWVIYYYAPIATRINIGYNLKIVDEKGDSLVLKDIYRRR